jgi:AraC-like DNA-binding protein
MAVSESPELVRLDTAARELGCHVETLRLRVRDGRLRASRGPHGTYFVARDDLHALEPPHHGQVPIGRLTRTEVDRAWAPVSAVVLRSAQWRENELALAQEICAEADVSGPIYRLISVHRLRKGGVPFDQIADELGISPRHARRLYHRRVYMALRKELTRRSALAAEESTNGGL